MNIVSLNMCANTTVIALKIKQNILSEYGYRVVIVREDNTGICHAATGCDLQGEWIYSTNNTLCTGNALIVEMILQRREQSGFCSVPTCCFRVKTITLLI